MPETSPSSKEQTIPLAQKELEQLREKYYEIRKFEIQNLWQRSLFLATFIVILLTGYGSLVKDFTSKNEQQTQLTHIVCCVLTFLGAIFSIIWIMMGKGSKAWYEIYEQKIYKIEREHFKWDEEYRLSGGSPKSFNNSLWSRGAGAFSVSRINILLGQVLFIICSTALFVHALLLLWEPPKDLPKGWLTESFWPVPVLVFIIVILFLTSILLKFLVKSKSITKPQTMEKNKEDKPATLCTLASNIRDWLLCKTERKEKQKTDQK